MYTCISLRRLPEDLVQRVGVPRLDARGGGVLGRVCCSSIMCIYMYKYVYIYIYIFYYHMYTHIYIYIYMSLSLYIYIYIYIYIYTHIEAVASSSVLFVRRALALCVLVVL